MNLLRSKQSAWRISASANPPESLNAFPNEARQLVLDAGQFPEQVIVTGFVSLQVAWNTGFQQRFVNPKRQIPSLGGTLHGLLRYFENADEGQFCVLVHLASPKKRFWPTAGATPSRRSATGCNARKKRDCRAGQPPATDRRKGNSLTTHSRIPGTRR